MCFPAGKSLFLNSLERPALAGVCARLRTEFSRISPERETVAGLCARLRTHFSLSRQRKVSKRKATPLSATRSLAAGNLRCGLGAGNRSNSLRSDNRGSFSRPKPTAQAHTEGTQGMPLVALRATLHTPPAAGAYSRCNARHSRASSAARCAVMRRRVAQGWTGQGSRLFERSEFERDPVQTEQRSEPARSDGGAFGSPFFCLLFFGEAKKSECAVGRMSRPACAAQSKYVHHIKRHSPTGARPGQQPHQKPSKEINSEWTAPA